MGGSKPGQGRPLGHCLAWLKVQAPPGEQFTHAFHVAQKMVLSKPEKRDTRLAERQEVATDNSFRFAFDQERKIRDGNAEDWEPLHIPYPR